MLKWEDLPVEMQLAEVESLFTSLSLKGRGFH